MSDAKKPTNEQWAAAGRLPRGDVSSDSLPPKVMALIEAIGREAALKLVEKFGGYQVYIPAEANPDHPLAKLIGLKAFTDLVDWWSEEHHEECLRLPRCANLVRKELTGKIVAMRTIGRTHGSIALELRMTERGVRKILKRAANPKQGKLF